MKKLLFPLLLLCVSAFQTNGQDCSQKGKAKVARANMGPSDKGLTCSNAALFYTKLCIYRTEPLTVEQGKALREELLTIRKAYNDYGVYCQDIGPITDQIRVNPTITLMDEPNSANTDDIIMDAIYNVVSGGSGSASGARNCDYAALNKFGSGAFSSPGAENAANQYEGYRCHCINGTAARQFDGSKFTVQNLSNLKANYDRVKKGSDPRLSPLPQKCADSPRSGNQALVASGNSFQQSFQNYRVASGILRNAQQRNQNIANELRNMQAIVNTGNPFEIEQNFQQVMNQIQQMDQNLKQAITEGYVNDAATIVSQYNSGNTDGAAQSTLAGLGSIVENQEAKKRVEEQRRKVIAQRQEALRQASNDMIEAHNEALQNYIEAAALALQPDRENYFMENVFYHSSSGRYIAENFSYSNLDWAKPHFKEVEKPEFRSYYNPKHEQHFEAALRKKELYDKYENPELWDGAIKHISTAIDLQPKNSEYYLTLARMANPEDMVLSSINYIAAYNLKPKSFNAELKEEMNSALVAASIDAARAIDAENTALVRDYIDAGLFEVIDISGMNMLSYAASKNKTQSLEVVYDRELVRMNSSSNKTRLVQEAIVNAAAYNSVSSLRYFLNQGYGVDFKINRKAPLDYSAENKAIKTFFICFNASENQSANLKEYQKTPLYVAAFASETPQNAADALCLMDRKTQEESIHYLISLASARYQHRIQNSEPQQKNNSLQNIFEQLGGSGPSVGEVVISRKTPLLSAQTDPYIESIRLCSSATETAHSNAYIQKKLLSTMYDAISSADEAFVFAIIKAELLNEQKARANAPSITTKIIQNDQVLAFQAMKEAGYLSDVTPDGTPITFEFLKSGKNILKSGLASDLNFKGTGKNGGSILHNLAFVESPNQNYLLNEAGLDVNRKGPHGWTPLHFAARERNPKLCKALLQAGADKSIKDEWGRKPLNIAKEREFKDIKKALRYGL